MSENKSVDDQDGFFSVFFTIFLKKKIRKIVVPVNIAPVSQIETSVNLTAQSVQPITYLQFGLYVNVRATNFKSSMVEIY